jgi:hypothetical protein
MSTGLSVAFLAVLGRLSSLTVAQVQFADTWQTQISPATGKHLFTLSSK